MDKLQQKVKKLTGLFNAADEDYLDLKWEQGNMTDARDATMTDAQKYAQTQKQLVQSLRQHIKDIHKTAP